LKKEKNGENLISKYQIYNRKEYEAKKSLDKLYHAIFYDVRVKIESSILEICENLIKLINNYLLNHIETDEGKTMLTTMKADHLRYIAEIKNGEEFSKYKSLALDSYKESYLYSLMLNKLNKIRLRACLNYSVFYYEIINDPIIALKILSEALDESIKELNNVPNENLSDESMQDSLKIIDLFKKNVSNWYQEIDKR